MAKRARVTNRPTKPLVKTPMRIGVLDARAVVGELRQMHEEAEDPAVERMPADDELFGALLYTEKHAHVLRRLSRAAQGAAALKRVQLWEYLREQAEGHQARAVSDAREAGVQWGQLAPALAVAAPNAAYNKAKRLKAIDLTDETPQARPVRRTPEAVLQAERRLILEQAAERRNQEAAQKRHELLVPIAVALMDQRDDLRPDDDADYWLEEIAAVLPHCRTPLQMVSLHRYVEAAVRAFGKLERQPTTNLALTPGARLALAAATEFVNGAKADNGSAAAATTQE
ncbi:hypothetical protein [Streptomyces sp. NPDC006012]|uniref:hypothetical protein n=1 Tax=Streptomyces sp. NPDC006012 TaxID=3364739 RepID=UPI00368F18E2